MERVVCETDGGTVRPLTPHLASTALEPVYVVIAAYNEEASIGRVVGDLIHRGWPVVVVDDGSTDDTAAVARRAGAYVLRHKINLGQGAALQTGIETALAREAASVVTFDADGQHAPEDILPLISALRTGADIALGSRFLGQIQGASFGRQVFLRLAVWVSNLLCGLRLSDAHCGLRAIRGSAARGLRLRQNRMAHATELLCTVRQRGWRLVEVPVTIHYTGYSRRKGQGPLGALRILFDHFVRGG